MSLSSADVSCRSLLFWAWDDVLDPDELVRQIHLMKDAGVGGFFMHSRFGLETPYLGKDWDACVETCSKEAAKLGMEAWLYDEDRWPSGSAGGLVQQKVGGLKGLTLEVVKNLNGWKEDSTVVALFAAKIQDDELFSLRKIETPAIASSEVLLVIRLEKSGPSPWFNGYPPPDNLNDASEQAFLNSTHEHYKSLLGCSFSSMIHGVFTDEPSLYDRHAAFNPHRGWIPWTDGLETWIEQRLGYDLLDKIPYVFFNGAESEKTRFDYWHMIALRFEDCYSGQIGTWCEKNGIAFTGHFLQEDKMGLCARVNGSLMPHYSHEDICGIDLLKEQTDEYLTVKQCASVAAQYGKKGVLVETYAATGWGFTFQGQKWVGDWEYVLGVTRRCQHLALYSLRGCRKRDYPPSFNYQNTWWKEFHVIEDYFARVSSFLQFGKAVRNVLVLHPISTVWLHMGCSPYGNPIRREERDVPAMDAYGYHCNDLVSWLCRNHFDCDLGDETILERIGSVVEDALKVGCCTYRAVVVPDMETIYRSTFQLLSAFKRQGGTILVLGRSPWLVDGNPDEECRKFFDGCLHADTKECLTDMLPSVVDVPFQVSEGGSESTNVLMQVRKEGKQWHLFLVNNDRKSFHQVMINTCLVGKVEELDALTGKVEKVPVLQHAGQMLWNDILEPCDSRLYQLDESSSPCGTVAPPFKSMVSFPLDGKWEYQLDRKNALILDRCSWSLDGGAFGVEEDVWKMQRSIRKQLDMIPLENDEIAQRYTWDRQVHPQDGKKLVQRFSFRSEGTFGLNLVMESPEDFQIFLDGKDVSSKATGTYVDESFSVVPIGRVKAGIHFLELRCSYRQSMELENVYLIGNFGVSRERVITGLPDHMHLGDWTEQGLLHYPGSVTYKRTFDLDGTQNNVVIDIGAFHGTCADVVMGRHHFPVPWVSRNKVDISSCCKRGTNSIKIVIYGSLRNFLGPFHLKDGEPVVCNGGCFMPKEEMEDSAYHVVPYGLDGPVRIMVMKN